MMRFAALALSLLVFTLVGCDKKPESAPAKAPVVRADALPSTAKLPEGLNWESGGDFPAYADANAKKGGLYQASINSFPLTFRLYGPNSNSGGFVGFNRELSFMGLTTLHPATHQIIPALATAWAVLDDNRTVFYRLDPDARWSDGAPLTADDFVFAYEFLQSEHIQAPFYNQYIRDHFETVAKVDDHHLKIVAKKPSWRLLFEMDLNPIPRHATKLTPDWVKDTNWSPHVTATPYVIGPFDKGKAVTFVRVKDWWGQDKPRFKGMYNFDEVEVRVVRTPEVEFELFKKGNLDLYSVSDSTRWVQQTDFEEVKKGYVNKQLIYVDKPSGIRGLMMNLEDPILKDLKIRKALAHCLDFKTINEKFLYGLEDRQQNFFDTYPPYRDPNMRAYPFDLAKANQLLDEAGFKQRNAEGIRTKDGQTLRVVASTGSQAWLKYLGFYKETAKKAGIDLDIKLLDGAALYKSFSERNYMALILVYSGGQFPGPRQFLHSENAVKGSNNLFMIKDPRLDELIEIYEFDLDEKKRVSAIFEIERIVKEKALLVPFWRSDHTRLLWWRYIKGPKGFVTPSGMDLSLLWYDAEEKEKLDQARKSGQTFEPLPVIADPFSLKK
ncbi:MAG: extracellular solute-binding protein [bacterium]|nr:extracellular solute-binding protein [bacterium]